MSDARKCLAFPLVALPGVVQMPAPGEGEQEAARVFYVSGYSGYREVGDGDR